MLQNITYTLLNIWINIIGWTKTFLIKAKHGQLFLSYAVVSTF